MIELFSATLPPELTRVSRTAQTLAGRQKCRRYRVVPPVFQPARRQTRGRGAMVKQKVESWNQGQRSVRTRCRPWSFAGTSGKTCVGV